MSQTRWKKRPEGSNWGDFGPDDQIGRLNLITREKVKQGLAEAREGLTFCLSLPLDYPGGTGLNPRRRPPILRPNLRDGRVNFNVSPSDDVTDVFNDDLAIIHLQYSTQWDALCHVGSLFDANDDGVKEKVFYNGFRAGVEITGPDSAKDAGLPEGPVEASTSNAGALGIETIAAHGVQGRAAMVDLRHHLGDDRTFVGYDLLMSVIDKDTVEIETGDIVCLHTGFADVILGMRGAPDPDKLHNVGAVLDGRDGKLLNWITDSGLAALVADNYAVEGFPASPTHDCPCSTLPLHEHCLFKNGIPLGELWHLTPLASWLRDNGRYRFLVTAPPLRLPGAVGSPVTPIGTV